MDQPAHQQGEAVRAVLRAEAGAYLNQMKRTIRCFDTFCNDMQAAVNELSQHHEVRYLEVTLRCDYIQDCMKVATNQSAVFLNLQQDDPDRTRKHISMMTEALAALRYHRNRIADLYLESMFCKNPKPLELEKSLDMHMSLLLHDVQRLASITMRELHELNVQPFVEE